MALKRAYTYYVIRVPPRFSRRGNDESVITDCLPAQMVSMVIRSPSKNEQAFRTFAANSSRRIIAFE